MKQLIEDIVLLILGVACLVAAIVLKSGWEIILLGGLITITAGLGLVLKLIKKNK